MGLAANRDDARPRGDGREVSYAAAHELRAPVVGICQLVEAIQEDHAAELPEEVARRLVQIRDRADRLDGLLRGLIKYLRAGDVADQTTAVDLRDLVDEIARELRAPPGAVIHTDAASIEAPRCALRELLGELIDNALRHAARRDIQVRICAARGDDGWQLSVSDNGPGIPAAYRDRVWRPFVTLEAGCSRAGLGLAIARRIAESRGGHAFIDAAPGGGTRVSLFWPDA